VEITEKKKYEEYRDSNKQTKKQQHDVEELPEQDPTVCHFPYYTLLTIVKCVATHFN
jgi:hypothetical protein